MIQDVSISPDGIEYPLPLEEDYEREYARVRALVTEAKTKGEEIVGKWSKGVSGAWHGVRSCFLKKGKKAQGEEDIERFRR